MNDLSNKEDIVELVLKDIKEFQEVKTQEIQDGALSGLEKAGLKYIDHTFRQSKVHRAILNVLQDSLKERSFITESRKYGIDILNDVVQDEDFQKDLKDTVDDIRTDKSIELASIDLLSNVVTHNTTRCYIMKLMTEVMTNTEANDVLINSLTEAVVKAVQKPETNKHIGILFNKTLSNDAVKEEAKSSLLYKNFYESFWHDSENYFKGNCKTEQRIHSWLKQEMSTLD